MSHVSYIWMSHVSNTWMIHNIYWIYISESLLCGCVSNEWRDSLIPYTRVRHVSHMCGWVAFFFLNRSRIPYRIDSQYLFGTYAWVATVCVYIKCVAWLIHTTYMNESRIICINESRIIYIWMSHVSYIWMSHVSHVNEWVTFHMYMNASHIICIWMSHVSYFWMSHVSNIYEWVTYHMYMNESRFIYINESRIIRMNERRDIYMNESQCLLDIYINKSLLCNCVCVCVCVCRMCGVTLPSHICVRVYQVCSVTRSCLCYRSLLIGV